MHASWQIDMCKDWKNHLSSAPSACDFQKFYLRSIPCCNKCQVNLFLFQRFDIMLILSSSPKVGICSNRSNLHISSFLRFVSSLWIVDKHCNIFVECATNNYVGHTPAKYWSNLRNARLFDIKLLLIFLLNLLRITFLPGSYSLNSTGLTYRRRAACTLFAGFCWPRNLTDAASF